MKLKRPTQTEMNTAALEAINALALEIAEGLVDIQQMDCDFGYRLGPYAADGELKGKLIYDYTGRNTLRIVIQAKKKPPRKRAASKAKPR